MYMLYNFKVINSIYNSLTGNHMDLKKIIDAKYNERLVPLLHSLLTQTYFENMILGKNFDIDLFQQEAEILGAKLKQDILAEIKDHEASRLSGYLRDFIKMQDSMEGTEVCIETAERFLEGLYSIPLAVMDEIGEPVLGFYKKGEVSYTEEEIPPFLIEQMLERDKSAFSWEKYKTGNFVKKAYFKGEGRTVITIETITQEDGTKYLERIKRDMHEGLKLKKDTAIMVSEFIKNVSSNLAEKQDNEDFDTYQATGIIISYLKRKKIAGYDDIIEKISSTPLHEVVYDRIKTSLKLNPLAEEGTSDKKELDQILDYIRVLS